MEKLATSDLRSSIEGQRMWQDLATQARTYNNLLQEIRRSTMEATAAAPSGSNGFAKGLNINGAVSTLTSELGMGGVGSFAMSMGKGAPQAAAVAGVATVLYKAGKAASEFEVHLDRLQALTGLTDEKMKQVSDTAIEMSKNFKASAGEIVDSMTLIGSQAPQLLSDPEALASVTEAANVLAKAAGIEVIDSAKGITTVMNQMKVSASEVSGIINVLAASSQQGSADVAYLNTAFEKAGTAASSAGMNYTQLAAVIEAVAPKFSSADVAGSQLASTLLKLSINASD